MKKRFSLILAILIFIISSVLSPISVFADSTIGIGSIKIVKDGFENSILKPEAGNNTYQFNYKAFGHDGNEITYVEPVWSLESVEDYEAGKNDVGTSEFEGVTINPKTGVLTVPSTATATTFMVYLWVYCRCGGDQCYGHHSGQYHLKCTQMTINGTGYYSSVSGNTITDLSQVSMLTDLTLDKDSTITAAVYDNSGKMVDIVSEELSAGTYTNHIIYFKRSLLEGDTVRLFTTDSGDCSPLKEFAEIVASGSLPEKFYKIYLKLGSNNCLYACIDSLYDSSKSNMASIYYALESGATNSEASSESGNLITDGDIGYNITNAFSPYCTDTVTNIQVNHYIDNENIATASTPVSIHLNEGTETPFNITNMDVTSIEHNDHTILRYTFTVDQTPSADNTYIVLRQNIATGAISRMPGNPTINSEGQLVTYLGSKPYTGQNFYYKVRVESISLDSETSATITYLPKGEGYAFDNDTLTPITNS